MKKSEIEAIPIVLPESIDRLCRGARVYDSSCSQGARVYFIDRDGGYYLKTAPSGVLRREAMMTDYFHGKGLGAEVIEYTAADRDLLLTRAIAGEDCTHRGYLDDPRRLCDLLAERLRALHELDCSDCPIQDKMKEYIHTAEKNYLSGSYDSSHFPDSFGYRSAEEAYSVLNDGKRLLKNDALLHGDYCLPNVMLDGWRFAGFIDLDQAGVGDRHIDLFWGRWSLGFNLKTDLYGERFLDAYGRDKVDEDRLRVVAAAEVFG